MCGGVRRGLGPGRKADAGADRATRGASSGRACRSVEEPHRERGGASVCLLVVGLALVLAGMFGAAVGAARTARQQAAVAADFGALAGAGRALEGDEAACSAAAEIAVRNGGRLLVCRLDDLDVLVTAEVSVTVLPGLTRVATASARAGPLRG
ncbi:Rv3654c family TadE-like protein [Micromonospora musae]|uniref:Rv3654c family TadE-like protein n=1 Tax=Micromonospora musae TaxID=1894970 RepID=UPI003F4CF699